MIIFQSYLLMPETQFDGRWMLIEPSEKRCFALPGKRVTPILQSLLGGYESPEIDDDLRELADGWRWSGSAPAASFNNFYASFVFDYPFLDYGSETWFEQDVQRMRRYAVTELPPPNRRDVSDGVPICTEVHSAFDSVAIDKHAPAADRVAAALAFVSDPVGSIAAPYGPWLRKTSPSGGARHPIEVAFASSAGFGDMPAGLYRWDSVRRTMVRSEFDRWSYAHSIRGDAFCLTGVMERSMWRYRTPRSLRPVLIDCGHVVATLEAMLDRLGLRPKPCIPAMPMSTLEAFVREPLICLVGLGNVEVTLDSNSSRPESNQAFHLNPLAYLLVAPDKLHAACGVTQSTASLGPAALATVHNAIPNKRGTARRVELRTKLDQRLAQARLLIPRVEAMSLVRSAAKWCSSNWYLSLLWLTEAYFARHPGLHDIDESPAAGPRPDLRVLLGRRTCRHFSASPVTRRQFLTILRVLCARKDPSVGLHIDIRNVTGVASGIYSVDLVDCAIIPCNKTDGDTAWIARQEWTRDSAFTILIWAEIGHSSAASDVASIIQFGRLAQSVIIAAEGMDLRVFVSPATNDRVVVERFLLDEGRYYAFYSVSIGWGLPSHDSC